MATSKTEKESFLEERLFDLGDHYKTTIRSPQGTYTGRGSTAEQAEKVASERYDKATKK